MVDTENQTASRGSEPRPLPAPGEVRLRLELDRRVSFALQQNGVPLVKLLQIDNGSDVALEELELTVAAEPAFAHPFRTRLERVEPRSSHHVAQVELVLSPRFLSEVGERVAGLLRVELSAGGRQLACHVEQVEVLARDEWGGLASLPELLASFVMPNHPAVEAVLGEAARVLAAWTGDGALSGYQSRDRERVARIAAAIWRALASQGIDYVNPPASFEAGGQKVRTPERILESRLATCLDLALFYAACLEQAGLHPLLLLTADHAFTALWLDEESFPDPAGEDGLRVKKRVELGEILAVETTGVTARPPLEFERARQEGWRRLERPADILCVLDVRRARAGRILPLPERMREVEGLEAAIVAADAAQPPPPLEREASNAPAPAPDGIGAPDEPPEPRAPATRLDQWKSKLLDTSLRNRLLNYRPTRKSVALAEHELAALEDALAGGASFTLRPRPRDFGALDPRDAERHRARTGEDPLSELLATELGERRLVSTLDAAELERNLIECYREARTQLEEGGASALFLALGFLVWREAPRGKDLRAPILLLPLELHRRSLRSGFELRLADEEPRLNVTLLERLREEGVELRGLDPLPEDERGVDVPRVLHAFRAAVRDKDGWQVVEEAAIAFFAFAKFLMWRDLAARAGALLSSPIVSHLALRPGAAFEPDARFLAPAELDQACPPEDELCPLPADSSQLAAVLAAADGRSFVLEGPPGTGKSQTIANLIAHCLARGKTVLFVAEKRAALEVVHARLERIGLGRACLELHSNKARKRSVVEQLGEALDAPPPVPEEWERTAGEVGALRDELNAYVEALHRPRASGETLFQGLSRLIGLREAPYARLELGDAERFDADRLAALRESVARLATAADASGGIAAHPWGAAGRAEHGPAFEREVAAALERARATLERLRESAELPAGALLPAGERGAAEWSRGELALLAELAALLVDAPAPPLELLVRPDWSELHAALGGWVERGRRRDLLRGQLFPAWRPALLELDLDALAGALEAADASGRLGAWWRRRGVRKALRAVRGETRAPFDLRAVVEAARELRAEERALSAAGDEARDVLGRYWEDGEPQWSELERLGEWSRRLRAIAAGLAGADFERAARLRAHWARLALEGREALSASGPLGARLAAFEQTFRAWRSAGLELERLLELDLELAFGPSDADAALARIAAAIDSWSAATTRLREWSAWLRARAEALAGGLAPLVEAAEREALAGRALPDAFERGYLQWWTETLIESEPPLRDFFRPEHERRIARFREADERLEERARSRIAALLARAVPRGGAGTVATSEPGILRKELQKRRRHLAVRALFRRIPTLLPRLKPCVLMSPMSVAQYLDPDAPPFDLIVFDEASQIPVWDAIGALARGRQAIVVGDPKQLPPTSFFQRAEADDEFDADLDEEAEDARDLESILDECLASGLEPLRLAWHYRSLHESLIAFSNHHYYDNRLLTFPSPLREAAGVSLRPVPDGIYDGGRSRTNRREAEEVVAEIARRLRDPSRRHESIGVVTFNIAQQSLVEDLLERLRQEDPELEFAFAEDAEERLFVKNLENVQGDERDVILFSICYGPDAAGRVRMHFGPLNREGGERRLNVAVTRARKELVVFATLQASQIDLARTRARGVRDLKVFLEYAERGISAIGEARALASDPHDSPFERALAETLRARGHLVHSRVGCSGYRIDLAIADPDEPAAYLLAVECDGDPYRRSATARDRDRHRAALLRRLGWELHRVWSSDFWRDPTLELARLEEAIARARARRLAAVQATAGAAPAPGRPAPGDAVPGDGAVADAALDALAPADVAPADVAPGDVAPGDVAPGDVAPGDRASADDALADGVPADGALVDPSPAGAARPDAALADAAPDVAAPLPPAEEPSGLPDPAGAPDRDGAPATATGAHDVVPEGSRSALPQDGGASAPPSARGLSSSRRDPESPDPEDPTGGSPQAPATGHGTGSTYAPADVVSEALDVTRGAPPADGFARSRSAPETERTSPAPPTAEARTSARIPTERGAPEGDAPEHGAPERAAAGRGGASHGGAPEAPASGMAAFDTDASTAGARDGSAWDPHGRLHEYRPCHLQSLSATDDFHAPSANALVREAIAAVVRLEGPILLDLAARRVAARWRLARLGSRVLERVRTLMPPEVVLRGASEAPFLWPRDLEPQSWTEFRVPTEDPESRRAPSELPPEEIRNAALHLLRQHLGLPLEDLARETARLLGHQKLGSQVRASMLRGIELLVREGYAALRDGSIVLERSA